MITNLSSFKKSFLRNQIIDVDWINVVKGQGMVTMITILLHGM
jgi:hypothetical protein